MEKLNGSIKFTKICDEWLLFKRPRVKESTYSNYKFTIDRYLKVDFRQAVLESLVDYDFNLYIEKLQKKLASKTIRKLGIILKSILRYAERKYDYDFKLDLMSLPSIEQKEIEIFNDKERLKLERKILKTREIKELGILTSLYSGLRIGEVCALRWSDINFEDKLINITHTLQRVYVDRMDTKVIIGNPKTQKSIRKIPIAKPLLSKLKEIQPYYPKEAYILTRQNR